MIMGCGCFVIASEIRQCISLAYYDDYTFLYFQISFETFDYAICELLHYLHIVVSHRYDYSGTESQTNFPSLIFMKRNLLSLKINVISSLFSSTSRSS